MIKYKDFSTQSVTTDTFFSQLTQLACSPPNWVLLKNNMKLRNSSVDLVLKSKDSYPKRQPCNSLLFGIHHVDQFKK